MRVKKVKIGIKSVKDVLEDAKETMKKLEQGKRLKPVKEPEIYFTNFEALRKALTPKRLELLHVIKHRNHNPLMSLHVWQRET